MIFKLMKKPKTSFMKKLLLFSLILGAISCSSSKKNMHTQKISKIEITEGCPPKADCTAEIFADQSMDWRHEASTGKFYPELTENKEYNTVKMSIVINSPQNTVDGQYTEEIMFQWPKNQTEIHLSDKELESVNFTFGRFCFCAKDQVGHFKISKGSLEIKNHKITIDFENSQHIPQVLKHIEATFQ